MEINVIEENKKRMVFEIKGEGHTLANLLEKELWNDKNVTAAGYQVDHPLTGVPKMIVETSGSEPRKALQNAIKRLKTKNSEFAKKFKKAK